MISVNTQLKGCDSYLISNCWGKDFLNLMEKPTLDWKWSTLLPPRMPKVSRALHRLRRCIRVIVYVVSSIL